MTQPGTTSEPVLPPGHLSGQAQPRLSAAGLTLRPWRPADAPTLVRAYADPEMHQWHARSMSPTEAGSWVAYDLDRWKQDSERSHALHLDGWHDMHAHGLLAGDARPSRP